MLGLTRGRLAALTSTVALVAALALAVAASAKSPIVHRVSVGGPDACVAIGFDHPGCNANFSLVAIQLADGTVRGQYTDRLGSGEGFHAEVDCLSVVGNNAWIGGVIKNGTYPGVADAVGRRVVTRVQDNGTSAKDAPDRISFSFLSNISCTTNFASTLLDAPEGQVKVR